MILKELFSPLEIRGTKIKNRIVLAPMGTRTNLLDGTLTNRCMTYLEERAKGDVGLIIPEFSAVRAGYAWTPSLGIHSDRLIPALSGLANTIHNYGSATIMQIALHGGKAASKITGNPCIAPSSIESPLYPEIPVMLDGEEIEVLIREWVEASLRAKRAGFDGVEVHGAHGYLIAQFMSPHSNHRNDEWGGSFEKRMVFPERIVREIREECGEDFIIGFKYSAHEHIDNGLDIEAGIQIARHMEMVGIDYLHVAATSSELTNHSYCQYPSVPTMYNEPMPLVALAEAVKKQTNVPVIAAGGICEPGEANQIVKNGIADMVAVGRAYFADAYWGLKARRGEKAKPCIKCNTCHKSIIQLKEVFCTVNPGLLREHRDLSTVKSDNPKQVVIFGAGPAGLEAALQADQRGHRVMLYERLDQIGGALRLAGIPSFKDRIRDLMEHYEARVSNSNVELMTNCDVTEKSMAQIIKDHNPDCIAFATGGKAFVPPIPGVDNRIVYSAEHVLQNVRELASYQKIVVIGAGKVGLELSWMLSDFGKRVVVLESLDETKILADDHATIRVSLLHNLKTKGVSILGGCKNLRINEQGIVEFQLPYGEIGHREADAVIMATGYRPDNQLAVFYNAEGYNTLTYELGDCKSVRGLFEAIHEGYYLGRYII